MLALPAVIGGFILAALLFTNIDAQGPRQWIVLSVSLMGFTGLLLPRTRVRATSHIFALCISVGALIIEGLALGLITLLWPTAGIVSWVWLSLGGVIMGFTWTFSGLRVNRVWPESAPIIFCLGSLASWVILLNGQVFGVAMTNLFLFQCTLFGGWMGGCSPSTWEGKRPKGVRILATGLATISVAYTLAYLPPGNQRPVNLAQDEREIAYWVNGEVDGKDCRFALLLGDHGHEPISALTQGSYAYSITQLSPVQNSQTIGEVYQLLADADNERLEYAVERGEIPPFVAWLWKFRRVPRRGSIWVVSPAD